MPEPATAIPHPRGLPIKPRPAPRGGTDDSQSTATAGAPTDKREREAILGYGSGGV